MNVLFVSRCSENALKETRRILDQFAERCGERTWKTAITQQGLNTVKQLLKRTARKNTAVACHWFRGSDHSDLVWIVGYISKFNEQGNVPTNTTRQEVLCSSRENQWHTGEDVLLLSGIAGLFHDFGKANDLFQSKLKPDAGKIIEPYRHEWVSLRLFQAFVGNSSDAEWLGRLIISEEGEDQKILNNLIDDGFSEYKNPFKTLSPLAGSIGWLILSHHRLPQWPETKDFSGAPRIERIDEWLGSDLHPSWNSCGCLREERTKLDKKVWKFSQGTPWKDKIWRQRAGKLASRALRRPSFLKDWLSDPFTLHLARMVLMLSDHYYSSQEPTMKWQNETYKVYANTNRKTKCFKQKLEEHLVGVERNAVLIAKMLPSFRNSLPSIARHKDFKKRAVDPKFLWQNRAYDLACGLRKESSDYGFFGVNMASTGCGKTLANARIMYGLSDEKLGCRFSIALGLRTLTLQTGDALRKQITLEDEDLAVLIGSSAVRQLHEINKENQNRDDFSGSESMEPLLDASGYVKYEGVLADVRFQDWLKQDVKFHRLVSAPILVSTIDHLIPATDGARGGRQIAPMLRLLTSDLVLDEPDDFDLSDLPALCRLSNWAGMLGSRILISSATLPPSLVHAMFASYLAGREIFQRACGEPGRPLKVCCAWFDENNAWKENFGELESFKKKHSAFIQERASILDGASPLRKAKLLRMPTKPLAAEAAVEAIADALHGEMQRLHAEHAQTDPKTGKQISIGLIRMANINPMIAVAKQLFRRSPEVGRRVHYCVYHSQYPMAVRSEIEQRLDAALTRHDPNAIWLQLEIQKALTSHPEGSHLFVVLATPVAEVGRDHDYDWAIAEPSSMRSLIQLAGRVQRHRQQVPKMENIVILSRNYRALKNEATAYTRPGFELGPRRNCPFHLSSHDLHDILEEDQFRMITAIPRINPRNQLRPEENLVDLEHEHLHAKLFGTTSSGTTLCYKEYAALWWRYSAHWSFELQRRMPFRKSQSTEEYALYFKEEGESPKFHFVEEDGNLKLDDKKFTHEELTEIMAERVSFWGENNFPQIIERIACFIDMEVAEASKRFGCVSLHETESDETKSEWFYHQNLGVYRKLDAER